MTAESGPDLEMDWELGIFKALRGLWRAVANVARPGGAAERELEPLDQAERWTILAGLLAGRTLRVVPARTRGGVRGNDLLLPTIHLAPDEGANMGVLIVRLAIDATTARRRVVVPKEPDAAWVAGLLAAEDSIRELREELPRFADAWAEACLLALAARPAGELEGRAAIEEQAIRMLLHDDPLPSDLLARLRATTGPSTTPAWLWGRLIPVDAGDGDDVAEGETSTPSASASEAEAPPIEELEVLSLSDEDGTDLPLHAFEKVEMAEPYQGSMRQLDGEDDLADHLEALQEVDLAHLVRGGPQAHSVLRADIALDADIPDVAHVLPGEGGVPYPEWDARGRRWRDDWCHVYPTPMPRFSDRVWATEALKRHRGLIRKLTGALLAHRQERQNRNRQTDGDQLDIDAIVGAMTDAAAGRTPSQRLYIRRPRVRRDLATTVLLDLSLSSDSLVDNRRVLDVAREAVLVLGEVADTLGDDLQILAFASHTRHKVRIWKVRDWREPWAAAQERLGRLTPQGYTRIGPALRYATDELVRSQSRDRLLLLVSDGKPTDYDRYEGRYGIEDVRMALRQARSMGIRVHALAIDAVARDTLPAMMGPGNWDIMPHPDRMADALTRVWGLCT